MFNDRLTTTPVEAALIIERVRERNFHGFVLIRGGSIKRWSETPIALTPAQEDDDYVVWCCHELHTEPIQNLAMRLSDQPIGSPYHYDALMRRYGRPS